MRKISATKTDRSYQFNDNPVERKGGRKTGNLSATLAEELESKTAFTIPVFGGVPDRRECSCYMGDHGSAVSTFTDTGS